MRYNRYFACSLAFLCLLGGGASAWAQTDAEKDAATPATPAVVATPSQATKQDSASVTNAKGEEAVLPNLPDLKSPEEEFGIVVRTASAKGRTLLNNDDIKNERDAVRQLEREVTGRDNVDLDSFNDYYSLESSVERALATSAEIRSATERVVQSEAQYRQVQSQENVKFDVTNQTTYQSRPTVKGTYVTNPWCDVLKASVSKLLTTFGNLENTIAARFVNIGILNLQKLGIERSVAYKTKVAFLDRLKADAIVDVSLLHLGLTKESLADANKMYKQGVMARYDVIQSELQVVEAAERLATSNSDVDEANSVLADLLSIERLDEPVRIGLEKPAPITVDESCTLGDLKRLAEKHRFELLALDRNELVLEKTRQSAESSNRPEIGLSGDYLFQPGVMGAPSSLFQMNLYINWAAWDGGERLAKLDEIDSQIRENRSQRKRLCDDIFVNVERAWLNFKLTDVITRTAKKRVEAAWIFHDMARQRFLNGLGTSLEVRQALQSLNEAREAFVTACYDHDIAFASLEYEIGMDFPNRHLSVTDEMKKDADDLKISVKDQDSKLDNAQNAIIDSTTDSTKNGATDSATESATDSTKNNATDSATDSATDGTKNNATENVTDSATDSTQTSKRG